MKPQTATQPRCHATRMSECPIAEALVDSALHKLKRRKNDPVTTAIHARLDTLEEIATGMKDIRAWAAEIREWISTVTKVTRGMEVLVEFLAKWSGRAIKIAAAIGAVWASIRLSAQDVLDFLKVTMRWWK